MREDELKRLLEKYLNGTISRDEERRLERFDSNLLERNADRVFRDAAHRRSIFSGLWRVISAQIEPASLPWLRVAASIALLIGLSYGIYEWVRTTGDVPQLTEQTARGQIKWITLADGSKVRLNALSTLSFPERFRDSLREVVLSGEAFFEVSRDPTKPFIIVTEEVKTRVLGTSFNVSAREGSDRIEVTVASGKVRVETSEQRVELTPAEQARYDRATGALVEERIELADIMDWKDGILRFDDEPLGLIARKLEKWYGVSIDFENNLSRRCRSTGTFEDESLSTVLDAIIFVNEGLSFEFSTEDQVLIKGKCTN